MFAELDSWQPSPWVRVCVPFGAMHLGLRWPGVCPKLPDRALVISQLGPHVDQKCECEFAGGTASPTVSTARGCVGWVMIRLPPPPPQRSTSLYATASWLSAIFTNQSIQAESTQKNCENKKMLMERQVLMCACVP